MLSACSDLEKAGAVYSAFSKRVVMFCVAAGCCVRSKVSVWLFSVSVITVEWWKVSGFFWDAWSRVVRRFIIFVGILYVL